MNNINLIIKVIFTKKSYFNSIKKGEIDIITNGKSVFVVTEPGCLKRCGGQGDILVGLLSVYSYWAKIKEIELCDENERLLLGAILACLILRKAAKKAFDRKFIGLTAPDIIEEIIPTFLELYKFKSKL